MTRKELVQNYWKYYRMLEEKLLATTNYVELDARNFVTFSNEYAFLLQSIGAELDVFFKVYCGFGLSERKNISDYVTFVVNDFPSIKKEQIRVIGSDIILTPFKDWDEQKPGQSLSWWRAFDDIKHNRVEYFQEANLENVLNILAALFLLEIKMFTKATDNNSSTKLAMIDIPEEDMKLFRLPLWNYRVVSAESLREAEKYE